jgi:GH24 family phage-related lysozyme (muramidase)
MKTSTNGRNLIERYEGLILQSYDDANDHIVPVGGTARGTLTIGYGHTTSAGSPAVNPGMTVTKSQADSILAKDLQRVESDVNRMVKVPISQNQFDALVSFQFNTGALGKSSLLAALNNKDYTTASEKFMLYTNGRVNGELVPMAGLTRRRAAEKALFLKPDATGAALPTGVVAIAGAGTAASVPHEYLYWAIGGSVALVIITFLAYTIYEYKQSLKVTV